MFLRRFPGILVLGLLASLIAHAALFGGDHAMGGAYAGALLEAAAAGFAGMLGLLVALACLGAKNAADGTIVRVRLARLLPSVPATAVAASLWFVLGERLEPSHAGVSTVLTIAALVVAAWLVHRFIAFAIRLFVDAVFAVDRSSFAARRPSWSPLCAQPVILHRAPILRRRFARPPPIAS